MSEVIYGSPNAEPTRGPSPSIWKDCPVNSFLNNPGSGYHYFDDFKNSVITKETAHSTDFTSSIGFSRGDINWYLFCETTKLVDLSIPQNDEGVLQFLNDTSDQDVACAVSGNNEQGLFNTPKVGETKGFWFEARFKVSGIAVAAAHGVFVGLAGVGQAANAKGAFDGDAAALGAIDYVGFAILEGDQDDLIVAYNEAGAGTAQSSTGVADALVADTYVRAGFKLVAKGISTEIRFFIDGVDLGDDVAVDVSSTNANWPGDTDLDLCLSLVGGSAAVSDESLIVDWVRVAGEY